MQPPGCVGKKRAGMARDAVTGSVEHSAPAFHGGNVRDTPFEVIWRTGRQFERMRRQEADRLAPAILIERLVPHDVPVSDAELAEFHKRRSIETHMMLVLVFTKVEAERAKSDLDRGEDFAAVASRYNPAGMLPPGGDLGFQQPGGLIEPLDQYLYDGPIGRLLGPDEIKGQG